MIPRTTRAALCALALLALDPVTSGQDRSRPAESGSAVNDEGAMFGPEAVRIATDLLRREGRVPVVVETVKSIKDFGIGDLAKRRHEEKYPGSVYVLMASTEHKISEILVPQNLADRVSDTDRQAVREAFLDGFKRNNLDAGLAQGVKAIEAMLAKVEVPAPAPTAPRNVGIGRVDSPLVERNHVKLTLEGARLVLKGAEAKASEMHVPQNIAVVDDGGHLLAFGRMDGARPASVATAMTKATTAATFRQATGTLPAGSEKPDPILNLSLQLTALAGGGKLTVLPGGVPITVDGQIIGAVGVGGGTGEQDAEVARAGVAAFLSELKAPAPAKEEKTTRDPLKDLEGGSKPEEKN